MAKIKGICRNEDCEMCDQIQEAEKSNFKCEKCGKDLIPFGNKTSESSGGPNKKLIGIIAAAVVILGGIGAAIAFSGGDSMPVEKPVAVAPVDSDSIKAAQMEAENQRLKDSLAAVEAANAKKQEVPAAKPVATPVPVTKSAEATVSKPTASSGTKNLGYATFKGTWPNDVNGRMVFKTSHVIDSRDPKGRMAEAGDYVIGEWSDGHLVQGIWYGADNQVKGSVIIGR